MNLHIYSASASLDFGHGKEYVENVVNKLSILNQQENRFDNIYLYTSKLSSKIDLDDNITLQERSSSISLDKQIYKNKYKKMWRFMYGIDRIRYYSDLYNLILKNIRDGDKIYLVEYEYFSLFLNNRLLRKNPIITLHTMDFSKNLYSFTESLYKKISGYLNKKTFKYSKRIIVHGEYIRNSLVEEHRELEGKVRVANYGIYQYSDFINKEKAINLLKEKYNFNISSNKINLLIFGVIRTNKGILRFIREFKKIENVKDFNLLIVGKSYDLNEELIYDEINNYENIYWINTYIPDSDIEIFNKLADYLVLPYLENMNSQSGPLKLAMGYELPVLSTKYGEIGNFTLNYKVGEVFDTTNYLDFQFALDQLVQKNRNEYVENIKKVKKQMSWDEMAYTIWDAIVN
ncbi:glycosyltransferase family 4 protein [Pontibacillus marinus]|uniref:Glycosyl transferase family 1 domain-containing protein n=1 Tax=Pontibacillus marinus BH030004 = DSM 16465 TaxID=1385511 RepID=A0A0A5GGE1_9BACI|nr:glycosyltransferase family 4 protein [Pontibacillus marinus]KGX91039.1 hypothetical protein N783_13505 [Pontibacillus marinus BH030004 = DSM 16465]